MKVVLFDIDGTLVRAGGAGRKALAGAALALYGKKGVIEAVDLAGRTDSWICRQVCRLAGGRVSRARTFSSRPAPERLREARRRRAREVLRLQDEYLRRLPRQVRAAVRAGRYALPPGVKALVKRLSREKDVLLGLGTGNLERGARIKLEPSGFNPYFAFGGFGSDGVDRCRILRIGVRRARRLMPRGAAAEVFIVGDTPHDVSAGRKAGYKTIAVGTGFSSWESLVRARPDHLARDFRGMRTWLGWLGISPRGGE
ncbi:MAG: HAD family hydrolase [Elusimicrobia bacterium]|nr:HAD family hydrolase [Elusimicrobiota bacterium]